MLLALSMFVVRMIKQIAIFLVVFFVSLILFSLLSITFEEAFGKDISYIRIPDQVVVKKKDLYLGDIAEIHIKDKNVRFFAKRVRLGSAPIPGSYQIFQGRFLRREIYRKISRNIRLILPERVRIISGVRYVSGSELKKRIISYLETTEKWKKRREQEEEMEVSEVNLQKPLSLPDRPMSFLFETINGDDLVGNTSIKVRIMDKSALFKELWVRVKIQMKKQVVVAIRDVERGETLTKEMLTTKYVFLNNAGEKLICRIQNAVNNEVQTKILRGNPILSVYLKKPLLVKFGDIVSVIAKGDTVELQLMGRAYSSGVMNNLIRVQNTRSKKFFIAEIVGKKLVQVSF